MRVILNGLNKVEVEIDRRFYKEVMKHSWHPDNHAKPYYRAKINQKNISLHRFIMDLAGHDCKGKIVDHKNRDRKNNRLDNLRFTTTANNVANAEAYPNKIYSKYRGVTYAKDAKRAKPWKADYGLKNKCIHIGKYATEVEAAIAYNNKVKEIRGEFAYQNNIMGE